MSNTPDNEDSSYPPPSPAGPTLPPQPTRAVPPPPPGAATPPSPPSFGAAAMPPPQPSFGAGAPPVSPSTADALYLPPQQPNYGNSQDMPTYVNQTAAQPLTPAPPTARRSKGKIFAALGGAVVLIGAGTFAVAQMSSNDSGGGAASPTELGQKLVSTLNNEDILGAVDLLLPGERETFRQPMLDLVDELTRLTVLDDSADLSKIQGLDIQIDEPDISVDETNVDDIADVHVNASASVTVDGDKVPIGSLVTDLSDSGDRPDLDASNDDGDFDVTFASVEKDGRWYISLFYSAAESSRGDNDIPEKGVQPDGADSPDGALDNLLTSVGDLDLEAIISELNPNEAEALQRYAPLFLDDAQSSLDDAGVDLKVSGGEYEVTGTGNTRQVAVRALKVDGAAGDQRFSFELRDGCVIGNVQDQTFNSCDSSGDAESTDSAISDYLDQLGIDDSTDMKTFIEDLGKAFSDFEMHGIVVDNVGGKWYVSPIGTSFEFVLSTLRALDKDEINQLVDEGKTAFQSIVTAVSSGEGTAFPDETDTGSDWYSCLNMTSSDDAAACIRNGIDDGTFDAADIPAPFQYPDCGLFDYYNGDQLYSDSAADFNAAIAPATQCIVDHATADGLDLDQYTPEFTHPDCFADVNPYSDSADQSASQDAYDCATAGG